MTSELGYMRAERGVSRHSTFVIALSDRRCHVWPLNSVLIFLHLVFAWPSSKYYRFPGLAHRDFRAHPGFGAISESALRFAAAVEAALPQDPAAGGKPRPPLPRTFAIALRSVQVPARALSPPKLAKSVSFDELLESQPRCGDRSRHGRVVDCPSVPGPSQLARNIHSLRPKSSLCLYHFMILLYFMILF